LFHDRVDAGEQLARALGHLRATNPLVLGIPRGGVPVAYEVARALQADLDVVVVRKLGAPRQPELAIGAVTSDGTLCLNEELLALIGVDREELARMLAARRKEAEQREQRLRAGRPPLEVHGRTVIVIDDGLATGATMRAALRMIRKRQPERLVAAVPLGAPETCASIAREVDELVCPQRPEPLFSVGEHYRVFDQTSDREVERLLRESPPHVTAQRAHSQARTP
jgi:putative phosphoribosyl transferase